MGRLSCSDGDLLVDANRMRADAYIPRRYGTRGSRNGKRAETFVLAALLACSLHGNVTGYQRLILKSIAADILTLTYQFIGMFIHWVLTESTIGRIAVIIETTAPLHARRAAGCDLGCINSNSIDVHWR